MVRPLDGYPDAFGSHKGSVFPHQGPDDYTQMTAPSPHVVPITGGDRVYAVEAGLKYFDAVIGGFSDDGLYEVVAVPLTKSNFQAGAPADSYGLVWYHLNTRTQVTAHDDLSGSFVRLTALGPK